MKGKQLISTKIEQFYTKFSEESRLENGMGVFEFERVKSLIEKYILTSSSTIIDVGGGTGKYSEWLSKNGHHVHLIEPVSKHIKIAQKRSNKLQNGFTVQFGKAQKLNLPNNYADLVILHGPLYHLQNKTDRDLAIMEAKRVLKNDGIILGFAINYTASTLVGLLNGLIHEKPFFGMCEVELTTGIHNPPNSFPRLLTEAYYHRPEQLKDEFTEQGLLYLNTYAVEGMIWLDKDYFGNMLNPSRKETLMKLMKITENDSCLLPFSPHMMIAVKKQEHKDR